MAGRLLSGAETDSGLAATNDVLFAQNDSATVSPTFTVDYQPLRLVAFGLTEGRIDINRVLLPESEIRRDNCGRLAPPINITLEKRLTIGGHRITLTPVMDEVVIDATGVYRLSYMGEHRLGLHVIKLKESVSLMNDTYRNIGGPILG